MLQGFYELRLPDMANKNHIKLQVNWKEKDEKLNNCQVVKFMFPDGTESYVKREDLNFFLFTIGQPADQMKMIPQRITRVSKYKTMLGIEAKKDIKKGEKINVEVEIPLPAIVDNIIGDYEEKHKTKSGLIVPGGRQ